MKKLIIILLFIEASNTFAQVAGNYQYQSNTSTNARSDDSSRDRGPSSNATIANNNEIILEVNGIINVEANDFVVTFNLVQVAESVDSTNQIMNRKVSNFQQELNKIGIGPNEIKVDMISLVPKYDIQVDKKLFSKTYNEVPAGFELQKNVSVHYKKSEKLDEIILSASKLEIYDLVKVDYYLSDNQVPLDTIRNRCLKEVKTKIKSYEMIGFKMDTMAKVMADHFKTVYPPTRYYRYAACSKPSLHAAKKKESTVNEIPKVISQYYSGVDYDQYDIVINPVIVEPVVQVSYTITVKYFLYSVNPNGKYYLITPMGETKEIRF